MRIEIFILIACIFIQTCLANSLYKKSYDRKYKSDDDDDKKYEAKSDEVYKSKSYSRKRNDDDDDDDDSYGRMKYGNY